MDSFLIAELLPKGVMACEIFSTFVLVIFLLFYFFVGQ
jgi:hypothetical protein